VGLLVVLVVVVGALLLASNHKVGELIGAHAAGASPQAPALSPTRLLGLPAHTITNPTKPLVVTLSAPAAPQSPPPTLNPSVAGSWSAAGNSLTFTPASTLEPCSSYTLTVWARTVAGGEAPLGRRRTTGLNVACPPIIGLQQALARLGYLGARFHTFYDVSIPPGRETRQEAAANAYHPPRGRFSPDPANAPPVATGRLDAATRGALLVYQTARGLEVTGEPNRATWASLLAGETGNWRNPKPYTWVTVSESTPETLEIHRGRHVVLSTPANTGVPGAETAQGVFPIFSRYASTTMSGTDVDGTKYKVPDVPWVNYFNGGDAVHGYPRASYGFPQSNGCVELPIETAHAVYQMLGIGDLVEVS